MVWGSLIVWYLFLAGIAAGAYLAAAFVEIKYPQNKKIKLVGRLLSPVLLAFGLLFLMIDAEAGFHNPLRFFGLVMNPGSVMTLGVYVICVFLPISIISAVLELLGKRNPKALTFIGTIFAFGIAVYTGILLGVVQAYPLWNNAALPILFVLSALSTGIAAVSLGGLFLDRKNLENMQALKKGHLVLLGLEVLVLAVMLIIVGSSGATASASVASLVSGSFAPLFWIGVVVFGLLIPLCTEGFIFYRANKQAVKAFSAEKAESSEVTKAKSSPLIVSLAVELCVLLGGFFLRYTIVLAALPIALF